MTLSPSLCASIGAISSTPFISKDYDTIRCVRGTCSTLSNDPIKIFFQPSFSAFPAVKFRIQ
ncbi:hypothetical protein BDZ94DRAFT_1275673, partial [Collybia nuda]